MADTRKTWSSRIGFVLASAGAAVGLGAIWKFPYMVGTNGGSAFVFPYILMTFTVGLVLLIAEVALGRVGRGGIVTAYRNLGGKAWVPAGYLGVLTGFLVLCFYSAIGGLDPLLLLRRTYRHDRHARPGGARRTLRTPYGGPGDGHGVSVALFALERPHSGA